MSPRCALSDLAPWLEERFDRSGGPGGQNVNKVATRATLYFDFEACERLGESQRERIRTRLARRLSKDGRLRVVAATHRDQARNRAAAGERLLELLDEALARPRTRKATRPTAGSKRRRLEAKRQRSDTKRQRRPDSHEG